MHAGIQQGGRPDNWFTNPMSNFETSNPSLFERCFAAVFSGLAAGLTYAVWIYFRSGQWGPEQLADLMGIGKWVVLARGVPVVEINPQPTPLSGQVSRVWRTTAAVGLPALVGEVGNSTRA
jgi:hypothetical protein